MKFRITLSDPEQVLDLDVDTRDQVQLEMRAAKQLGFPVGTDIQTIAKAMPTAYLALWCLYAARRTGVFEGTFEQWVGRMTADPELLDEAEVGLGDPTPPTP